MLLKVKGSLFLCVCDGRNTRQGKHNQPASGCIIQLWFWFISTLRQITDSHSPRCFSPFCKYGTSTDKSIKACFMFSRSLCVIYIWLLKVTKAVLCKNLFQKCSYCVSLYKFHSKFNMLCFPSINVKGKLSIRFFFFNIY